MLDTFLLYLSNLIENWNLAQSISILSFFIGISAFFNPNEKLFKYQIACSSTFIGISLCLLGNFTGGIIAILNGLRTIVSIYHRKPRIMYIFLSMTIIFGFSLIKHPMEILPIFGTLITTWAMFRTTKLKMRCIMLMATMMWLTHNIWAGISGGILSEGSFLLINAFNITRFYLQQRKGIDPFAAKK